MSRVSSSITAFLERNQEFLRKHQKSFPKTKLTASSNVKLFKTYQERLNTLKRNVQAKEVARFNFTTTTRQALGQVTEVTCTQTRGSNIASFETFLERVKAPIDGALRAQLGNHAVTALLTLHLELDKPPPSAELREAYFISGRTRCMLTLNDDRYTSFYTDGLRHMYGCLDAFSERGSNWRVKRCISMSLSIHRWNPLRGAGSFLPLPECYANNQACTNVANNEAVMDKNDNRCFLWSILAHLHPQDKNPNRLSHYRKHLDELNLSGLTCPVPCNDYAMLRRFQKLNNLNLNVFLAGVAKTADGEKMRTTPLFIGDNNEAPANRNIDLLFVPATQPLLIEEEEAIDLADLANNPPLQEGHWVLIKNFNRLMFGITKHQHAKHFCRRCLGHFTTSDLLQAHIDHGICTSQAPARAKLPDKGKNEIRFTKFKNQQRCPFIIYADFESNIKKHTNNHKDVHAEHENVSYCMVLLGDEKLENFTPSIVTHRRDESHDNWEMRFLNDLDYLRREVAEYLRVYKPLDLTQAEEQSFQQATQCHICGGALECDEKGKKQAVRDHCHLTGAYRGAAHNKCNLNYNLKAYKIPVVFHNLKGYDGHFIIKNLQAEMGSVSVIANNSERFTTINIGQHLKIIDSFAFLNSSLDKLVDNLSGRTETTPANLALFPLLRLHWPNLPEASLRLLLRKGMYPYEYMDSLDRFKETQLPPPAAFTSSLTGSTISDEDYQHALNVWRALDMKTMGDYHDTYLKCDTLLLAHVFESFRDLCLKAQGLDPCWYLSLPSYSWDAMLKYTQVNLSLFHSEQRDMYEFVEKGIRGGQCMITKRYAKANNKYLSNYDPTKPSSQIIYLDANNLYGDGMSKPLPTSGFHWLAKTDHITADAIQSLPDDGEEGFIFEVDLDYPSELHNLHNDLPFCLENIPAPYLSAKAQQLASDTYKPQAKLMGTFLPKRRYIIHYTALKQALQHGLILRKVHRVLGFLQSPWLKPYIQFNTDRRTVATSDFEKDFWKLLNNAIFGKTMENVRDRMDYHIVLDPTSARNYLAKAAFKRATIIRSGEKGILGIELQQTKVELNKPCYAGFCILEHSKVTMYNFHYNYAKRLYANKAQLLMTDTDSLFYYIESDRVFEDMKANAHLFDTSAYPRDHPLYSTVNKKVIGKMKDESNGEQISEFAGLRAKMYSYSMDSRPEELHIRAKGVKTSVAKRCLSHESYLRCLMDNVADKVTINSLRSYNHCVYGVQVNKVGLSAFDDKRHMLDDGIHTLAYGHYATQSL